MAVPTTNAYDGPYEANGVATTFPFTFTAQSSGDVGVQIDGVAVGGFSVTISPVSGGSVTFDVAPVSGIIYIVLQPAFTQNTKYEDGSAWRAGPQNAALDRAALRDQALLRDLDHTLRFPLGEGGFALPGAGDRASKFLSFDAEGGPFMSAGSGADSALRADLASSTGGNLQQITTQSRTRTATSWVGDHGYDATSDILRARSLAGYTGDDGPALQAVADRGYRDVEVTPEIGIFQQASTVTFPLPNTRLRFRGGAQAAPWIRLLSAAGDGLVIGNKNVPTSGAGGAIIEGIFFRHENPGVSGTSRLGYTGGALPSKLSGEEAHLVIYGSQSARVRHVGGFGARHVIRVMGGSDCQISDGFLYGGVWNLARTDAQEAISQICFDHDDVHGYGVCHRAHHNTMYGANLGSVLTPITVGAKTVYTYPRQGPRYGLLVRDCEDWTFDHNFSGQYAEHNIGIVPNGNSHILENGKILNNELDESTESAVYALVGSSSYPRQTGLQISGNTFNGQLAGKRGIWITGVIETAIIAVAGLQLHHNIFRAHLGCCVDLVAAYRASITHNTCAGYNMARNDVDAGNSDGAGMLIRGYSAGNIEARFNTFGDGINLRGETDSIDPSTQLSPNATQWGIIGTVAYNYSGNKLVNPGLSGGLATAGGTLDTST